MKIKISSVLLLLGCSFIISCVSLPFSSKLPEPSKDNPPIKLSIDPIISDSNGEDYMRLREPIVVYAGEVLKGCAIDCSDSFRKVELKFTADSNSRNSSIFKIWEWTGILSLGIIPVIEKTEYTLTAKVEKSGSASRIEKKANRYLIFSIFLAPFNLFRDWKKDSMNPEKSLINGLANDPDLR